MKLLRGRRGQESPVTLLMGGTGWNGQEITDDGVTTGSIRMGDGEVTIRANQRGE